MERLPSQICVVALERSSVSLVCCTRSQDGDVAVDQSIEWDPSKFLSDESGDGTRLFEEIARRLHQFWQRQKFSAEALVLSMPGTLKGKSGIVSSSRLNIRRSLDVVEWISSTFKIPGAVTHDAECIAFGEYLYRPELADIRAESGDCLAYVHADEGVGSRIVIEGRPHNGAGVAGLLGRMIIDPRGSFNDQLRAAGTLESYVGRPGLSMRLLERFIADQDKREIMSLDDEAKAFRNQLQQLSVSGGARTDLPFRFLAKGLEARDPLVASVVADGARALAVAVNAIMTIASPHAIVLGGRSFSSLPGFYEMVLEHTRTLSWPNAWNSTKFLRAVEGGNLQVLGAIALYMLPEQSK